MMWIDGEYFADPVKMEKAQRISEIMALSVKAHALKYKEWPLCLVEGQMLMNQAAQLSSAPLFPRRMPTGGFVIPAKTGDMVVSNAQG